MGLKFAEIKSFVYLCRRYAAPRQLKQALLRSVCTIFAYKRIDRNL